MISSVSFRAVTYSLRAEMEKEDPVPLEPKMISEEKAVRVSDWITKTKGAFEERKRLFYEISHNVREIEFKLNKQKEMEKQDPFGLVPLKPKWKSAARRDKVLAWIIKTKDLYKLPQNVCGSEFNEAEMEDPVPLKPKKTFFVQRRESPIRNPDANNLPESNAQGGLDVQDSVPVEEVNACARSRLRSPKASQPDINKKRGLNPIEILSILNQLDDEAERDKQRCNLVIQDSITVNEENSGHTDRKQQTPENSKKTDSKPCDCITAFDFFLHICRVAHKKKHPDQSVAFSEFSRKCAERWKTMTEKEKKRFQEMADMDKKRYEKEMQEYVSPEYPKGRGKKHPHCNNPGGKKPRRRMSAYAFFVKICRSEHKKKHPNEIVAFSEWSHKCAARWKTMTKEQKKPFQEMADRDNKRYESEMQDCVPPKLENCRGNKRRHCNKPDPPLVFLSAFDYYCKEVESKLKKMYPEYADTEIAEKVRKLWDEQTPRLKKIYEGMASATKNIILEEKDTPIKRAKVDVRQKADADNGEA